MKSEEQKLRDAIPYSDRQLAILLLAMEIPFQYDGVGGIRVPYETLKKLAGLQEGS